MRLSLVVCVVLSMTSMVVNAFVPNRTFEIAETVRIYSDAAELGDSEAQNFVGVLHAAGKGVLKDLVIAYKWFAISAALGNELALRNKQGIALQMTEEQIEQAREMAHAWWVEFKLKPQRIGGSAGTMVFR